MQWDFRETWTLGLELRTPGIIVFASGERSTSIAYASAGTSPPIAYETEELDGGDFTFKVAEPALAKLGISHRFRHGQISAEADARSPASSRGISIDREATYNFRAGGTVEVSPEVDAGLGLFTDRAGTVNSEESEPHLDFYGIAGGLRYTNRRDLAPGQDSDRLMFSTTLGIRYAYGWGESNSVSVDSNANDEGFLLPGRAPTRVHEATLNIASSLYF
jgi:hypothetical protein